MFDLYSRRPLPVKVTALQEKSQVELELCAGQARLFPEAEMIELVPIFAIGVAILLHILQDFFDIMSLCADRFLYKFCVFPLKSGSSVRNSRIIFRTHLPLTPQG